MKSPTAKTGNLSVTTTAFLSAAIGVVVGENAGASGSKSMVAVGSSPRTTVTPASSCHREKEASVITEKVSDKKENNRDR